MGHTSTTEQTAFLIGGKRCTLPGMCSLWSCARQVRLLCVCYATLLGVTHWFLALTWQCLQGPYCPDGSSGLHVVNGKARLQANTSYEHIGALLQRVHAKVSGCCTAWGARWFNVTGGMPLVCKFAKADLWPCICCR